MTEQERIVLGTILRNQALILSILKERVKKEHQEDIQLTIADAVEKGHALIGD